MFPNDPYTLKAAEYLLGISFLLLFIPFWKYAMGGAAARATARLRLPLPDMFQLSPGVLLHPGHAWMSIDSPGVVSVGMDDFARQLVGPLKEVDAPPVGSHVAQGQRVWTLKADSKSVDMLSPVTGVVVALNEKELRTPRPTHEDAYGRWLMKVRSPRLDIDTRQLLENRAARQYLNASWEELSSMMTPELGTIMHDGGTPVNGFARGIDESQWESVARRFLRS